MVFKLNQINQALIILVRGVAPDGSVARDFVRLEYLGAKFSMERRWL